MRKCTLLFMSTFTASPTSTSGGKEPVDSTETVKAGTGDVNNCVTNSCCSMHY